MNSHRLSHQPGTGFVGSEHDPKEENHLKDPDNPGNPTSMSTGQVPPGLTSLSPRLTAPGSEPADRGSQSLQTVPEGRFQSPTSPSVDGARLPLRNNAGIKTVLAPPGDDEWMNFLDLGPGSHRQQTPGSPECVLMPIPTLTQTTVQTEPLQDAGQDGQVSESLNKRRLLNDGAHREVPADGAVPALPGRGTTVRATQQLGSQPQQRRAVSGRALPTKSSPCLSLGECCKRIEELLATFTSRQDPRLMHDGTRLIQLLRNPAEAVNLRYDAQGNGTKIVDELMTLVGPGYMNVLDSVDIKVAKLRKLLKDDPTISEIAIQRKSAALGSASTLEDVLACLDANLAPDVAKPISEVLSDPRRAIQLFFDRYGRPATSAQDAAWSAGWTGYPIELAMRGIDWGILKTILLKSPHIKRMLGHRETGPG